MADRLTAFFSVALKVAVTATLLCIVVITFFDVVGRYIFNAPLPGAFEIQEFGMGILFFSGLPLITLERGHISVSLVESLFKKNAVLRRAQVAIFNLVSAAIVALLTYCLWVQAVNSERWGTSSAFLRLPHYPVMYFMTVMASVTCLVLLAQAFLGLRGDSLKPEEAEAGKGSSL